MRNDSLKPLYDICKVVDYENKTVNGYDCKYISVCSQDVRTFDNGGGLEHANDDHMIYLGECPIKDNLYKIYTAPYLYNSGPTCNYMDWVSNSTQELN